MTQAAHRRSTLRFWLAVVAALEAGDAIAIVGGWTPGRAAVAAVALGAGGTAAPGQPREPTAGRNPCRRLITAPP